MNRIKSLRKEKNISLAKLSEILKTEYNISISPATLMRYENGKTEPKLATWQKLADFFGVPIGFVQGVTNTKEFNLDLYGPDSQNVDFKKEQEEYADKIGHNEYILELFDYSTETRSKDVTTILDALSDIESKTRKEKIDFNESISNTAVRADIMDILSNIALLPIWRKDNSLENLNNIKKYVHETVINALNNEKEND